VVSPTLWKARAFLLPCCGESEGEEIEKSCIIIELTAVYWRKLYV